MRLATRARKNRHQSQILCPQSAKDNEGILFTIPLFRPVSIKQHPIQTSHFHLSPSIPHFLAARFPVFPAVFSPTWHGNFGLGVHYLEIHIYRRARNLVFFDYSLVQSNLHLQLHIFTLKSVDSVNKLLIRCCFFAFPLKIMIFDILFKKKFF